MKNIAKNANMLIFMVSIITYAYCMGAGYENATGVVGGIRCAAGWVAALCVFGIMFWREDETKE